MNIEEAKRLILDKILEKPREVLNVFNSFFGEDKVDFRFHRMLIIDKLEQASRKYLLDSGYTLTTDRLNKIDNLEADGSICSALKHIGELNPPDIPEDLIIWFIYLNLESILDYHGYNFNLSIVVHFPEVVITNEVGQSHKMQDVYTKTSVGADGHMQGYMQLTKTTFSLVEYKCGYIHSHIPKWTTKGPYATLLGFSAPCFGSGPIRSTMITLSVGYEPDMWYLYCAEMSEYVETESLKGGPYMRMEDMWESNIKLDNFTLHGLMRSGSSFKDTIDFPKFMRYLLDNRVLRFNFDGQIYRLGMSFTDAYLAVSRAFDSYFSDINIRIRSSQWAYYLADYVVGDYTLSEPVTLDKVSDEETEDAVLYFKGKAVKLKILGSYDVSKDNITKALDIVIVSSIVNVILELINNKYGKQATESDKRTLFI
nr:MAG TPA: hypothetical protein [Crassvirales sp.]